MIIIENFEIIYKNDVHNIEYTIKNGGLLLKKMLAGWCCVIASQSSDEFCVVSNI